MPGLREAMRRTELPLPLPSDLLLLRGPSSGGVFFVVLLVAFAVVAL